MYKCILLQKSSDGMRLRNDSQKHETTQTISMLVDKSPLLPAAEGLTALHTP